MSASKASRDRLAKNRFKNRRPTSREQLLPKKVAREEMKFDYQYALMKQQIEKTYPDPKERLAYINVLLRGLDEASREIRATETGRSSATEPNPSNEPKVDTSDYAVTEQTLSLDEPEQAHDGQCSCGCHEEQES